MIWLCVWQLWLELGLGLSKFVDFTWHEPCVFLVLLLCFPIKYEGIPPLTPCRMSKWKWQFTNMCFQDGWGCPMGDHPPSPFPHPLHPCTEHAMMICKYSTEGTTHWSIILNILPFVAREEPYNTRIHQVCMSVQEWASYEIAKSSLRH